MTIEDILLERNESKCELCRSKENLDVYEVPPEATGSVENSVLICETCRNQIQNPDKVDVNHWRCLNDSMWSQVPAVQVLAWRMLSRLSAHEDNPDWPQGLLDMLYLDDETLA